MTKKIRSITRCSALLALITLGFSVALTQAQTGCTVNVSAGSSLQSAIDNAASGAVVCLAAGTYKANLIVAKNLTLRGAGKDSQGQWKTIITGAERGKPVARIDSPQTLQVTLDTLAITSAQATMDFPFCAQLDPAICPNGLQVSGKVRVLIQNSRIAENEFSGITIDDSAQVDIRDSSIEDNMDIEFGGVVVRDDAQLTIVRTKISGNGIRGVLIAERAKATISQSQIEEHFNEGLWVRDSAQLELRDSTIQENDACGLKSTSSVAVRGGNNKFSDNGLGALCGKVPASLRVPLVPQGNRTRVGVPQDYSTLQEAIDAVAVGGTVVVGAGQYDGGLTIFKDVTLQGVNASQVQIKGGLSICCDVKKARLEKFKIQDTPTRALLVSGPPMQVTLSSITLSSAGEGGLEISGPVKVDIADSLFQSIKGPTAEAIKIADGAQVTISTTQVSRNEGLGVMVTGGAQATFFNSQISENQAGGLKVREGQAVLNNSRVVTNGGNGLEIQGTITVNNSQVLGNKRNGLQFGNGQATLTNNTRVAENGAHGIAAEGGQLTLSMAEVSMNREKGISLENAAIAKIDNSRVLNNTGHGITLEDSSRLEIKTSTLQGNGIDGLRIMENTSATITNNKVLNNNGWGLVAILKRCGFAEDSFRGSVNSSNNDVSGNKRGDVCLP
ncbi:right-handed parallel beta-helix repeat-containing protein [Candidatus Acetothermia bacterium]|nr:right-handed parallel beta-helix repeat-containing protein [Candidatus Acetothermia bacterium]